MVNQKSLNFFSFSLLLLAASAYGQSTSNHTRELYGDSRVDRAVSVIGPSGGAGVSIDRTSGAVSPIGGGELAADLEVQNGAGEPRVDVHASIGGLSPQAGASRSLITSRSGAGAAIGEGRVQLLLGGDRMVSLAGTQLSIEAPVGVRFRGENARLDLQATAGAGQNRSLNFFSPQFGMRIGGQWRPHPAVTLYGNVAAALNFGGHSNIFTERRQTIQTSATPTSITRTPTQTDSHFDAQITNSIVQIEPDQRQVGLGLSARALLGVRLNVTPDFLLGANVAAEISDTRAISTNLNEAVGIDQHPSLVNVTGQITAAWTPGESGRASLTGSSASQ